MIEIERARSALWSLDPGCDGDTHFRHACGSANAGLTFNDFHDWSKGGHNYKGESDCHSIWKSASKPGAVTAASLFRAALAVGWIDTTKGSDKSSRPSQPIAKPSPNPTKHVKQAASGNAVAVWERCITASPAEAYINRKQGQPDGVRVYPASAEKLTIGKGEEQITAAGGLVVPCYAPDGVTLQTLQIIPLVGQKKNLPGASFNDGFFTVGDITDRAYIVEGIGQAWAVSQATGAAAVVCFGAGRMMTVAKVLRDKYPAARLVIVPDRGKEEQAAKIAAAVAGQWIAMPADKPGNYDANDYALEFGTGALTKLLSAPNVPQGRFNILSADDICNAPPLEWLIKGIVPKQGTAVVFGASGSGKSFFVLDACCAIAGDYSLFYGYRVKHAPVVYVSLEGQAGLGNRLTAWKAHHGKQIPSALKFIIEPFNLLTDDVPALADSVMRAGGGKGTLIVIDTLNRAASGANENDSRDMGLIISATSELQRLTGGLVCLVHHAGKNLAAGMRGHSSLHGALDAVIEVSRDGDRRKWIISKAKDGADGVAHPFKLEILQIGIDADEDLITSCVAVPDDTPVPEKEVKPSAKNKLPASAKLGLAALQWVISHKGIVTPPEVLAEIGTGNLVEVEFVADLADWRERFKATSGEEDAAERNSFARAKKWLIENDKITFVGKWLFEKRAPIELFSA